MIAEPRAPCDRCGRVRPNRRLRACPLCRLQFCDDWDCFDQHERFEHYHERMRALHARATCGCRDAEDPFRCGAPSGRPEP